MVSFSDGNDLPESIDWREKGAVTPVQNMGVTTCNSAWAFSAIGAIEGSHFVASGELLKLSEQQCVDCALDGGCRGGSQTDCYEYLQGDSNLTSAAAYPYNGWDDDCVEPTDGKVGVTNYSQLPHDSMAELKAAIAKQPVAVTVSGYSYVF